MDLREAFERAKEKELQDRFDDNAIKFNHIVQPPKACVVCFFIPCRCQKSNGIGWEETQTSGV